MSQILDTLGERLALLQRYEARFGPLDGAEGGPPSEGAIEPPLPSPGPPLLPALPQQESFMNGLQLAIPAGKQKEKKKSIEGEGSAESGSGVDTPGSSPY